MAGTLKILAQNTPSATTDTTLYTVPAATTAVISMLSIAETGGTGATFRVAVVKSGDTLSTKHYLAYDTALASNDFISMMHGVTLGAGDEVHIYCSATGVAFNLFGEEFA